MIKQTLIFIASSFIFLASAKAQAATKTEFIKCESKDEKFRSCPITLDGDIVDVEVEERLSSARCKGDYGVSDNRVTVDDGCRAIFAVSIKLREYYDVPGDDDLQRVRLTCSSFKNEENRCFIGEGIQSVYIFEQLSSSDCDKGDDWESDYSSITVDNGCRAIFEVLRYKF